MPVSYISLVRQVFPDQPPYQWTVNQDSPWTPFAKRLAQARIALISTAGVYHKDQQPFDRVKNDLTIREIPNDVDVRDLRISHYYPQTDAEKDINCTFPIERLRELERAGFIGGLAPTIYTMMGRIFIRSKIQNEMAPLLLDGLRKQEVDAVLLVPV